MIAEYIRPLNSVMPHNFFFLLSHACAEFECTLQVINQYSVYNPMFFVKNCCSIICKNCKSVTGTKLAFLFQGLQISSFHVQVNNMPLVTEAPVC